VRFFLEWPKPGSFRHRAVSHVLVPARDQPGSIAWFLTGLPVASILGAPASGFILDHVHWMGIGSWPLAAVLEGLPAIVCGLLTVFPAAQPSRRKQPSHAAEKEAHPDLALETPGNR